MSGKVSRLLNHVAHEMHGFEEETVKFGGGARSEKNERRLTRKMSKRTIRKRLQKKWYASSAKEKQVMRQRFEEDLGPATEE
jgi:hypothetical protein